MQLFVEALHNYMTNPYKKSMRVQMRKRTRHQRVHWRMSMRAWRPTASRMTTSMDKETQFRHTSRHAPCTRKTHGQTLSTPVHQCRPEVIWDGMGDQNF
ncbi:hypothetical protein RHGRI_029593 [Rhododendron griersonianum]|uniref:Uncharacterized protein n=1 Tax=Rhododendron griersonianum TaxID=479676 RepID=A0AAV6IK52_9ERIC|nr:hypothetical protein RHGRI_029593 [Rhododendron griersonianum]